ncbi:MAG: sulfite exporter TauE/SafE family protein [candidate division NC10 bacterium]|nr:sulfite exporter TauE/SafE family protein [candidate division NC10 bacterium]
MSAVTVVILFVVGLLAGGLGGLLGIGGCVLMMPACRFGFQFSPALAVGTTLTAVVFTAGSGAWKHTRMGNVDWASVLPISISGVIGVLIGSWIFTYLVPYGKVIDLIVGLAFIWAALRMLYEGLFRRQVPQMEGKQVPGTTVAKASTGGIIGTLTGIIGLGGGYALVPSLVYALKSPMKIAIGTSLVFTCTIYS